MNVSMQDTYNLVWKLASVILGRVDPSILETYNSERRPVAQELMRMDSDLVHAYEQQPGTSGYTNSVDKIREQYTGFMVHDWCESQIFAQCSDCRQQKQFGQEY